MATIKESDELITPDNKLAFQSGKNETQAIELIIANKKITQLLEILKNNFKDIADYKYALDESSIIAITDENGIIKKVNNNFCKISKYCEQELLGQDHRIINSGYHSKEFMRDLWLTITTGKIWKGEIRNKAKDGSIYWVDTTIVPFLNEQGKPYQYLAIRSDITKRIENEEFRIQSSAQLESANKNLVTFAYISSHDLQEPLRKIQTFVSLILENENLSESGKSNFKRIQRSAKRAQQLMKDLIAFSRIFTTELKFEKIDLNTIIEDVKTQLKDTIQEKHAVIEATELCEVNIIVQQFRHLIKHLLNNSFKFSQPDIPPHIIVKSKIIDGSKLNNVLLSPKKQYCHITIIDNGIGFDPQYKDRIFEIFQRLHRKEEYLGTGMGLAIVKKIVENHNGIITATGVINVSTTFDIYIPVN